ncbi:MAG: hypothetical protein HPY89_00635 [Pelotomaculum sp.]|nr:hypothetical protein [Pelotomaculum sp.]
MDKIRQVFQTLTGKAKEKPHLAFIAALVLLVLFAVTVSQAAKPVSQPGGKQPAKPPASQQAGPVQLAWKGVPVLVSGPVAPTAPKSAAALDGSIVSAPLLLSPSGEFSGKSGVKASVTFPLGARYRQVSFVLAQQALSGDVEKFAYGTTFRITADGKTLLEKTITKESFHVAPQPFAFDIAGVNQLTVSFETFGKKVKKEGSSSVDISDQYGPFFPVLLGELNFDQ